MSASAAPEGSRAEVGALLAHMIGDYVIQSDWMAQQKTKSHVPALAHALTYTVPFVAITRRWKALAVICGTHFVIDRWRLARYVVWAKNQVAPESFRYAWDDAGPTGYGARTDPLVLPLLIAADNTMHGLCNSWALRRWAGGSQ